MNSGSISYSPDYKSARHQPPPSGTVRFCPECGQNDRVRQLMERHFAGGRLCAGVPVELEYALVDPERGRLERAVIEAAKAYGRANRAVGDQMKTSDYAQSQESVNAWQLLRDLESSWENLMLDSVDALLAFESEQEGNK